MIGSSFCRRRVMSALNLLVAAALVTACHNPSESSESALMSQRAAIQRVFERDDELGRIRNEASETVGVGTAARHYAIALQAIDYGGAPSDFETAYLQHADAWLQVAEHLEHHPHLDAARGEMHAALDQILALDDPAVAELERRLDHMWATWRDVEAVAARYGITSE